MFCLQKLQSTTHIIPTKALVNTIQANNFWGWLTFVWNRVSQSRIDAVGPDRACAEWLMRNGAMIRWKGHSGFVPHYDQLPKDDDPRKYYLQEVDATDSSISHHGFPYFKNCNYVKKVKLQGCQEVNDVALKQLNCVTSSLESLTIYKCYNISKKGLLSLSTLNNLKELHISGLKLIQKEDLDECLEKLSQQLPSCEIRFKEKISEEEKSIKQKI